MHSGILPRCQGEDFLLCMSRAKELRDKDTKPSSLQQFQVFCGRRPRVSLVGTWELHGDGPDGTTFLRSWFLLPWRRSCWHEQRHAALSFRHNLTAWCKGKGKLHLHWPQRAQGRRKRRVCLPCWIQNGQLDRVMYDVPVARVSAFTGQGELHHMC